MTFRKFRMLCVLGEFTCERLTIQVTGRLGSMDVIEILASLCVERGVPDHHIRSDQGPGFIAVAVREWTAAVGAKNRVTIRSDGRNHKIAIRSVLDAPQVLILA